LVNYSMTNLRVLKNLRHIFHNYFREIFENVHQLLHQFFVVYLLKKKTFIQISIQSNLIYLQPMYNHWVDLDTVVP
jgi:hypothetical protein